MLNGRKPVTPYLAAALDDALGADGQVRDAASRETAPAALPLRELADHAAEFGAWAEAGSAGPGTIAALDDEIARVAREYATAAPGPLVVRALDACRRVSGLLRQHQRLRYARDLHRTGSRGCSFLSVALGDLGQRAGAAAYARTALTLAEEAADPPTVALALSAFSKVAFWDGRRDTAAALAAKGYEMASAASTLRVLLACQLADASPLPKARDALRLAADALETVESHEPGLFSCGRVRTSAYAGTLRLREGDLGGVLAAAAGADEALADGEDAPFGSVMQVRINAALACLADGDASQASQWLAPVLALPAEMRLTTFDGKLARTAALATAPPYRGSQAARGLVDEVAGYLGADAGAVPYPLALDPAAS